MTSPEAVRDPTADAPAAPARAGPDPGGVVASHMATSTTAPAIARGVLVSAGTQLAAKAVHLVLNVVSSLAVVRYLAPEAYGVYAVVLTVTGLVTLAADFGLPKLAVREICAAPDDARAEDRMIGTTVALRLVLTLAGVGLVQLILVVLDQPAYAHTAAAVASLTMVGEAVVAAVVVVFQVRLAQHYEALVRTTAEILETAAVLALVAAQAPFVWLFAPPAAGAALSAAAVLALSRWRFGRRLAFDRRLARRLLVAALPIAPAILVGVLYRKLDSLALAGLRPPEDLGVYGAAAQPVEYALLSTALLMNVAFPLMSAAHSRGDLDRFTAVYRSGAESLVLLTVLLPVVLLFVARPLAVDVFGPAYARADVPLILLSVAVVPLVVGIWQSLALLVGGHQRATLYYNLAALVVSAVLSVGLVAAFGTTGAGLSAIGTAFFVGFVADRSMRRLMHTRLQAGPLLRIAAAAAVATAALAGLSTLPLPWPLRAAGGVTVFVLAVRATGAHRSLLRVVA